MQQVKNTEFGGERPLFASHDLQIDNVTIHAGESALKECSNIIAVNCRFEGRSTCCTLVFAKFENDGYKSGGS